MSKQNENWGTKETLNFLSQSNEALRIENLRLTNEIDRLISNIQIFDAQTISNQTEQNYAYQSFNYTLTK